MLFYIIYITLFLYACLVCLKVELAELARSHQYPQDGEWVWCIDMQSREG